LTIFNHCKWKIVHLKVHFNRHFTQLAQREYISWTYTKNTSNTKNKDNLVTSPDYKINVKVVSRYIAMGHDTYREPPYRYCIDISPYCLIPSKWLHFNPWPFPQVSDLGPLGPSCLTWCLKLNPVSCHCTYDQAL